MTSTHAAVAQVGVPVQEARDGEEAPDYRADMVPVALRLWRPLVVCDAKGRV